MPTCHNLSGEATQWLKNSSCDRTKLGKGNQGHSDETSGLYQITEDIQSENEGDVCLLKGESWQGNEGRGLIHRSPQVKSGQRRLFLSLDFIND